MTHRELCIIGAKWLKNRWIDFERCQYVVCELERVGESPDIFGFGMSITTKLIEVKISRSDFLSDKKKHWRQIPDFGLGDMRYFLCPTDLIKINELPDKWGLLYSNEKGEITIIKKAEQQHGNKREETALICGIMRREGVKSQVFNYKKYKNESL